MSFDVPKIHKWVENIESTLTEWAEEQIQEHYGIDSISELDEEQIDEIQAFVDEADDTWYSWVCIGFKNVINWWESENYDDD